MSPAPGAGSIHVELNWARPAAAAAAGEQVEYGAAALNICWSCIHERHRSERTCPSRDLQVERVTYGSSGSPSHHRTTVGGGGRCSGRRRLLNGTRW